jgi:predicted small secreted protein
LPKPRCHSEARRLGRRDGLMEFYMSRKLLALAAMVSVVSLGACNTVEGVGEDVREAGDAVDEAAEESNDGNPNTP